MKLGDTFTLIGRTGPTFAVVAAYDAAGFIPCVLGYTLDGAQQTHARVADVVPATVCAWCEPTPKDAKWIGNVYVSHGICAACEAKFFPQ